jgi:glycerophosphoryl diester phosphodiesterase
MKKITYCVLVASVILACATVRQNRSGSRFDFEAHRGGRGLMPENTIAAMRNAIKIGEVQTLELDVVISKDGEVVVSHDPYFNQVITTTPDGKFLSAQDAQKTMLYQMDYSEIRKYDVGLKVHPDFPRQQKTAAYKPLLADLIDACEAEASLHNRSIRYNIEIKSKKATDNLNHPAPAAFADKVIAVLNQKKIPGRYTIQSFDPRPLQEIHNRYPSVPTSFLVDKNGGDKIAEQVALLGFTPAAYSPVYTIVTQQMVDECHQRKMKIIPWTVNSVEEIQKLVDMGVDGVISDYPDLFTQIKPNKQSRK